MGLSFADGVPDSAGRPLAPPAFTSERALIALRSALQARIATPSRNDADFRRALRLMTEDAHRRGVRAEQMIVALKEAWRSLPEVQALPAGGPRDTALSGAITMLIEEFYAGPSARPADVRPR
jgi:hypothetical protein